LPSPVGKGTWQEAVTTSELNKSLKERKRFHNKIRIEIDLKESLQFGVYKQKCRA
jgi:hypothetical protein